MGSKVASKRCANWGEVEPLSLLEVYKRMIVEDELDDCVTKPDEIVTILKVYGELYGKEDTPAHTVA